MVSIGGVRHALEKNATSSKQLVYIIVESDGVIWPVHVRPFDKLGDAEVEHV